MGFNLPLGYSLKLEMTVVTTMIKSIRLTFLLLLVSCAEDSIQSGNAAGNDYQKTLQEQLITAAYADEPLPALRQADVTLATLRVYLRLCRDLQLLKFNQYEHVARMVNEIGRLLGGWIKSTR